MWRGFWLVLKASFLCYFFVKSVDNTTQMIYNIVKKLREKENEVNKMTQQERAYKLANLINNHPAVLELAKANAEETINFNELKEIKTKTSRSAWYDNNELNGRSLYTYKVLPEVYEWAKELYNIRKENEGNDNFDFYGTKYTTIKTSDTDHENLMHGLGVEVTINRAGKCLELYQEDVLGLQNGETMGEKIQREEQERMEKEADSLTTFWATHTVEEAQKIVIEHPSFGTGKLTKAIKENDDVVSVDFDGNVKQLTLSFLLERGWVK